MRIAVIDTTIHGQLIGGGHLFLTKLLRGLIARGENVHFISVDRPNELIRTQLEESGVAMHARIWPRNSLVDDATPALGRWLNNLEPDLFLISASGDLGWTVLPLLESPIATLMIGHSNSPTFYEPLRHYARFVTTAVGVSQEICNQFEKFSGLALERVVWIPYGVEASDGQMSHAPIASPIRLAFVGRVTEQYKRASDLIRIVLRLAEEGVNFTFDVVGDGDLLPRYREELKSEISAGRVKLHGWLASDKVVAVLRKSDCFLLTSDSEGFCIALTEAMANGCCPIVTDIESGNKQLVRDGVNGFLVPVGDVDAFVDRIRVLAEDRGRLQEMRVAAWKTGREYSVDRMVENYVACFERSIEDARSNPRTPDADFPLMESCRSKYPLWLRRIKARAFAR